MSTALPSIFARADIYPEADSSSWAGLRKEIQARIAPYLGTPSGLDPDWKVRVEVEDGPGHELGVLSKVTYEAEPGERVSGWLLVPHGVTGPAPTILTLHETNPVGKESMIQIAGAPRRDFASHFCKLGFVTFSPDHLAAGERAPKGLRAFDTSEFQKRHPDWSAVGKMIWDTRCALDAMETFPCIDPSRIGVAGHSLGGYGSFIGAAYNERIRAAAASCGMAVWEGNPEGRLGFARDHWYVHFPKLRPVFLEDRPLPFEFYELAALVAPRPFLNLVAMQDNMYRGTADIPEAGRRLADLYNRLGNPEGFANFLYGGGHDVTEYSRVLMGAWFQKWLGGEDTPCR